MPYTGVFGHTGNQHSSAGQISDAFAQKWYDRRQRATEKTINNKDFFPAYYHGYVKNSYIADKCEIPYLQKKENCL